MQVMDVSHIDGIFEYAPVGAIELDLPVHWPPDRIYQFWDEWDVGTLICWQVLVTVEEPDKASLHNHDLLFSDAQITFMSSARYFDQNDPQGHGSYMSLEGRKLWPGP